MSSEYRLNNMRSYYFKNKYTIKEEEMIYDGLKKYIIHGKKIIINLPYNETKGKALK